MIKINQVDLFLFIGCFLNEGEGEDSFRKEDRLSKREFYVEVVIFD